ncbi:MAG: putative bifunctional diguanylate cyclase/phosphodiesterase [Alphaproteobacteria bacterium]
MSFGRFSDNVDRGFVCVIRELPEAPQPTSQRELVPAHHANYDSLTGMPTRSLFMDRLAQAMASATRGRGRLGIMLIDLAGYGGVGERYGPEIETTALLATADRLSRCVRPYDTVARMGEDRFAILMPSLEESGNAILVGGRILDSFREPAVFSGHDVVLSPAIGISLYPDDGPDAGVLLEAAEAAMHEARSLDKAAFRFHAEDLNHEAEDRREIWRALSKALARDEFHLRFQPRIDIKTRQVTAFEALLRWTSRDLGQVGPARFIPALEEVGLMGQVGDLTIELACRQLAEWNRDGHRRVRMAINVSDRQLRHPGFVSSLRETLARTGADPRRIDLEITEEMLLRNAESYLSALWELREMNVNLTMDDFGSGYSSLSNLRRFPIQSLKIDRFFVSESTRGSEGIDLVNAIVSMGHSLGRKVVAMGVETEEQLNVLWHCGCDEAQGNLIAFPLPASEASEMLLAGTWHNRLSR